MKTLITLCVLFICLPLLITIWFYKNRYHKDDSKIPSVVGMGLLRLTFFSTCSLFIGAALHKYDNIGDLALVIVFPFASLSVISFSLLIYFILSKRRFIAKYDELIPKIRYGFNSSCILFSLGFFVVAFIVG